MNANRLATFLMIFLGCVFGAGMADVAADPTWGHVYVSGCVSRVGAVEIPSDGHLTVVKALILAGGLSDFADKRHIRILRKKSDGTTQTVAVDWVEIIGDDTAKPPIAAKLEKDVELLPGDVVVVSAKKVVY